LLVLVGLLLYREPKKIHRSIGTGLR
jgi:hypothetical protein